MKSIQSQHLLERARRALHQLPRPAEWAGEWSLQAVARARFEFTLRARLGSRFRRVPPGPTAPAELVLDTAVLQEEDLAEQARPAVYLRSGPAQLRRWLLGAEAAGLDLGSIRSVLELGCGSGRLIRHLRSMHGVELVGTDLSPACVDWCREHLAGIAFHRNTPEPPLTFAAPDSFDLAIAASVFTHIRLEHQAAWIEELYRVLRPGGVLVASVAGEELAARQLDPAGRDALARDGSLTLEPDDPRASVSTRRVGGCDLFQTRDAVRAAFGRVFTVCAVHPGPLDWLVLRKDG